MSDLKVTSNIKGIRAQIKKFPYSVKLALADGLDHGTRSFLSTFYKDRLSGPPGVRSTPGGIFQRFRRVVTVAGKPVFLRQSASQDETIKTIAKSTKDPMNMKVDIYTNSKAAGILESGGTIRSSGGMPIPLNDEAVAMKKNDPGAIKDLDFIVQNGKVFLGRAGRSHGPTQRLFILVHSVRMTPRLGFYDTWDRQQGRFNEIMEDALDQGIDQWRFGK